MELTSATDESQLVAALRAGDESAFVDLVALHTPGLLRVARAHVRDHAVAEEVVQDTWLALLNGLESFELRSSLRTWLYRVVLNRARTRGARDARTVPMSSLVGDDDGPTVDPSRFLPDDAPRFAGHWSDPPRSWERDPQVQLQSAELLALLAREIDGLPARQREVLVLRDIEGLTTEEVAAVLLLTAGNVRILLHRGRAKVRLALERYLA